MEPSRPKLSELLFDYSEKIQEFSDRVASLEDDLSEKNQRIAELEVALKPFSEIDTGSKFVRKTEPVVLGFCFTVADVEMARVVLKCKS